MIEQQVVHYDLFKLIAIGHVPSVDLYFRELACVSSI